MVLSSSFRSGELSGLICHLYHGGADKVILEKVSSVLTYVRTHIAGGPTGIFGGVQMRLEKLSAYSALVGVQ